MESAADTKWTRKVFARARQCCAATSFLMLRQTLAEALRLAPQEELWRKGVQVSVDRRLRCCHPTEGEMSGPSKF